MTVDYRSADTAHMVESSLTTCSTRLAPEHPFPAAVHDAWEAALYLSHTAPSVLQTSPSKIALGGSSAGGNLALILAQRALKPEHALPSPFKALLLSVPVTDK